MFIKGKQVFSYVGVMHVHDPSHPLFGIVDIYWDQWIKGKRKTADNSIVLVEGGIRPVNGSRSDIITNHGEAGYLVYLADKAGLTCTSPEPKDKDEGEELLRYFSKEEILHYYFVRQIDQWYRTKEKDRPVYDTYFAYLTELPARYGWNDYQLDIKKMEKIYEDIMGVAFDITNARLFNKLSDPYQEVSVSNKVALKSGQFRDKYIVGQLKQYWDSGKSIFSVYGHSHIEVQEEELRRLLT